MKSYSRLHLIFLACVLTLAGTCSLIAATPEEIQALYTAAIRKVDGGNAAAAMEDINRLLAAVPDSEQAMALRAQAKHLLGDKSGAWADIALAVKLNPRKAETYQIRALLSVYEKKLDVALTDMNTAVGLAPNNPKYLFLRAYLQEELGHDEAALSDLNRVLQLKPDDAEALRHRGKIFANRGDNPAALADFDRFLQLEPRDTEIRAKRAWMHFRLTQWPEATTDARRVLEFEPDFEDAHEVIGYAQFAQGKYADAAASLGKAADLLTDKVGVYPLLVRQFALQRQGLADPRLANVWGLWQDRPWQQALARFILGQITEEQLETALAKDADEVQRNERECEAHFYIGLVRLQAGDKSTARLRFKSALATARYDFVEYTLAKAALQQL